MRERCGWCRCLHFRFIMVHSFPDACLFKISCLIMKVLVCNLCLTRIKRKQENYKSGIWISMLCQFLHQMWIHFTGCLRSWKRSSAEVNSSGILVWHPHSGDILGSIQAGADRIASSRLVIVMDFPPSHVTTSAASRHRMVCQTSLAATALAGSCTDGALGSMVTW